MNARARAILSSLLAAVGLAAVVLLARRVGLARLSAAIATLAWWFPLVWLLEGARWLTDAWTTWLLYGPHRAEARPSRLLLASLAAYPIILIVPAGRFAGEALKAAAMRHGVGLPRAAATAVVMQALPLLAGAMVSIPCVIAAAMIWGPSWLTGAVALQATTAIGLGGAILWTARRPSLSRLVERVRAELGATAEAVQAELRRTGGSPAFGAAVLSRSLIGAEIVLLASAVDVPGGLTGGLATLGLHLVGQAAGDLVPAQIGATDAAVVLGADALGASAAGLAAAALVFHASQLTWAAIGALASLALHRR